MGGEMPFEDRALFGKRQKLSTCLGERHDLDILPHWVALTSGVDDGASRGIELSTCVIEAPFELGGEAALDLVSPHIASWHRQQKRSDERRVGKESVSTCRSRRSPSPYKKKYKHSATNLSDTSTTKNKT